MTTIPSLSLPAPGSTTERKEIKHDGVVVIVGANGSGKSRLGAWIEFSSIEGTTFHRISAQRALNLPDRAKIRTVEQATTELLMGNGPVQIMQKKTKQNMKWKGRPATHMLDDYELVLSTLIARSAERDRR